MQIRVQGGGVLAGAGRLLDRSDQLDALAGPCRQVAAGLRDPVLTDGLTTLGDVAADAVELVGQDLAVLAETVRAAVGRYGQVEGAVLGGPSR